MRRGRPSRSPRGVRGPDCCDRLAVYHGSYRPSINPRVSPMNDFLPALGRRSRPKVRRPRLRVESLGDRVTPTVTVNGTAGPDVITTRLLPEAESEKTSVQILVNGAVRQTIALDGAWTSPTTSWFLTEGLAINGLGGNDRIELGLIRPPQGGGYITVTGGLGNDTLVGGNGHDWLVGGPGADDLSAGIDEDVVVADPADVRL